MSTKSSIKPEEQLARSYADRLIFEKLVELTEVIKLSEIAEKLSGEGIGLATVRSLMASNPVLFEYHERRWIPAIRRNRAGGPFDEIVKATLEAFGGPMEFKLLLAEVALIRDQEQADVEVQLNRLIGRSSTFVKDDFDRISLTSWGFVAYDEPEARAFGLNRVDVAEVDALAAKLGADFNYRAEGAVTAAIHKAAPVQLKVLGGLFWQKMNKKEAWMPIVYKPVAFLKEVFSVPGFVYSPDGALHPEADAKKWVSSAVRLAEHIAPTIEVEDAVPIEMKPQDVQRMVERIVAKAGSETATRLLEEFYEVTPGTRTFPDDMKNIIHALREKPEVVWVGGDRFQKAGNIPEIVLSVPEVLHFHPTGVLDEEGEEVDVELFEEGLTTTLRKLLVHPLAMDVLDEDVQPALKNIQDTLRLVLKSIHRELGTFPLCQVPTGWLPQEPDVQELIVVDQDGRELQIWANMKDRLTYGWIEWWLDQEVESGAVFTLKKTAKPNVLEFAWLDQEDPLVYIPRQRMEALRELAATFEGRSTRDLLIEVMSHYPKGTDYLTLLAEVNVARRSSRTLIASLLSSYQCFYQRSGSPVWHCDPKKVEAGFDKTKRRFVKK